MPMWLKTWWILSLDVSCAWYQEEGIAVDVIQAVLACRPTKPADFDARVKSS
ncbi:hypothetical protein INT80_11195 [Gallibacterium anatis]|uniref:Uncharacterized protein n=1 Tax=Gallibacterium anatis TaxID=750 RepID=A0A930UT74_9PAST|nr:hypothetical protein [Gallibacterium anatis]